MTTKRTTGKPRLLLCASGAFAAYLLPGLILQLVRHFTDDIRVVLSRAAARMVSREAVEVASRNPVFVEIDEMRDGVYVPHIELGRTADLIVVFPASVNVIGKVANGIADELIPALLIATEAPVVFVPVANPSMLEHPSVRRNLAVLKEQGYAVLEPLPGPEVATREHLETLGDFPFPTLLLQMRARLRGR